MYFDSYSYSVCSLNQDHIVKVFGIQARMKLWILLVY